MEEVQTQVFKSDSLVKEGKGQGEQHCIRYRVFGVRKDCQMQKIRSSNDSDRSTEKQISFKTTVIQKEYKN